jgi:hypothetical protein
MIINTGSIVMTGTPVEYVQNNQTGNDTSAGAAIATGTCAEQTANLTANLTEGGARRVDWEKNYKP